MIRLQTSSLSLVVFVRVVCSVLAPILFNLYFDMAIHMALDGHRQEEKGIKLAYPQGHYNGPR